MKKILLSIAILAGFTISAQDDFSTNAEAAGNIQVNNGTGFKLQFNTFKNYDQSSINCLEGYIFNTFNGENALYSIDSLEDGNGFLKVSFEAQEVSDTATLSFGENRLPLGNCGAAYSGAYGADISANPVIKVRVRATTPVSLILTAGTLDDNMWITHDASLTINEIAGNAQWTDIEFSIPDTAADGRGNLEDVIGWAINIARGTELDAGEIHFDYIHFGSATTCENQFVISDTSIVNFNNHAETPKTLELISANTFQLKNGCDSTVSNYEYYCEEATRRDTNFVVTSNFSLSNYTQFELSQIIGQNRNGCDSLVYTYTSYVYCKPKETEETILIKTVNSTIFDDETDLFSSFTYQTEEGCDSIHSIYKHYEYSPNAVDTVYQTDTIYEMGTDTVFIKNTACDTLVIDLSGVTSTEYLASEFNLKVYPNPSSEILYLDYTKPASYTDALSLTIFDNSGRAIIQQKLPNNTIKTVDLSTMAAGTYFIIIYNSSFNKVAEAPFVVNK